MSTEQGPVRDPFGREVKSMRVSVTQRCDLACPYCHKEGQSPSETEMTPAEMSRIVGVAASFGVRKVKLTGGEPLLREDILEIVRGISSIVSEVSLTTNGVKLAGLASDLKRAGLRRVNVSMGSLDRNTFKKLSGTDHSARVRRGVAAAVREGLNPVKVNMVVLRDENSEEVPAMLEYCAQVGATLQLIEYETTREGAKDDGFASRYFSLEGVEGGLASSAFEVSSNELHRRIRYRVPANGSSVTVEVVRPMHNTQFCANCTRIRLSSDGLLKPCLLDRSGSVDVLTPMRSGATDHELKALFLDAVSHRRPYWS